MMRAVPRILRSQQSREPWRSAGSRVSGLLTGYSGSGEVKQELDEEGKRGGRDSKAVPVEGRQQCKQGKERQCEAASGSASETRGNSAAVQKGQGRQCQQSRGVVCCTRSPNAAAAPRSLNANQAASQGTIDAAKVLTNQTLTE